VNRWVIDYDFAGGKSKDEPSVSKLKAPLVPGREGKQAILFEGERFIEVAKSKEMDPSFSPFEIEVTLSADKDGTILAHGGQSLGFALAIVDGKALLGYRSAAGLKLVRGRAAIVGRWVTLTAKLTTDKKLQLFVDGKMDGETTVEQLIFKNPNDGMQIGTDTGSQVLEKSVGGYQGKMESIRLFMGQR
jgi:hypothetical protein